MTSTKTSGESPASFATGEQKQLYIGGSWQDASADGGVENLNPSTGQSLAWLAAGTAEDVDRAVSAASNALHGPWRRFTPSERQRVLLDVADLVERHYDELSMIDVVDMGLPVSRREARRKFIIEVLRYYAGLATQIGGETIQNSAAGDLFSYTLRKPVGVVGAIIPWNSPLGNAVCKLAPVLATGCTVVLKPAEEASLSSLRLASLMQELDLPPGVFNIVTGRGEVVGAALAAHDRVDKIAFTGSTEVGQSIVRAAAGNLKRLSLELGGKSPDIIFKDADLEAAVPGAAMGVFANSGQVCTAGTRIFVERPIYQEFVKRLADFTSAIRVGPSLDPATVLGPVVSERQLERILRYVSIGNAEGANLCHGGSRATAPGTESGYFVEPTVFSDVADSMTIAREEIFGPVACVLPFDTFDEVIARANATRYGLAGGVWTSRLSTALRAAEEIESGITWVNTYGSLDASVPFGGVKMSGWGSELSAESLNEYLTTKSIWIDKKA